MRLFKLILTFLKNYVNNKTHIFYVYPNFKICNNKKNYVSYYSHIFKIFTIERNYVNNKNIFHHLN